MEEGKVRQFETGATRDASVKDGVPKLSYRGFFCPMVLKRRAEYMNKHRLQSDGTLREPDNWKKGMPLKVYLESMMRHDHDVWSLLEGCPVDDGLVSGSPARPYANRSATSSGWTGTRWTWTSSAMGCS